MSAKQKNTIKTATGQDTRSILGPVEDAYKENEAENLIHAYLDG